VSGSRRTSPIAGLMAPAISRFYRSMVDGRRRADVLEPPVEEPDGGGGRVGRSGPFHFGDEIVASLAAGLTSGTPATRRLGCRSAACRPRPVGARCRCYAHTSFLARGRKSSPTSRPSRERWLKSAGARVAQPVEQRTRNAQVSGSIPLSGSRNELLRGSWRPVWALPSWPRDYEMSAIANRARHEDRDQAGRLVVARRRWLRPQDRQPKPGVENHQRHEASRGQRVVEARGRRRGRHYPTIPEHHRRPVPRPLAQLRRTHPRAWYIPQLEGTM
jgi:hypothetical protein